MQTRWALAAVIVVMFVISFYMTTTSQYLDRRSTRIQSGPSETHLLLQRLGESLDEFKATSLRQQQMILDKLPQSERIGAAGSQLDALRKEMELIKESEEKNVASNRDLVTELAALRSAVDQSVNIIDELETNSASVANAKSATPKPATAKPTALPPTLYPTISKDLFSTISNSADSTSVVKITKSTFPPKCTHNKDEHHDFWGGIEHLIRSEETQLKAGNTIATCKELTPFMRTTNGRLKVRVNTMYRCLKCNSGNGIGVEGIKEIKKRYSARNNLQNLQENDIKNIVANRKPDEIISPLNTDGLPVISICLGVTTNKMGPATLATFLTKINLFTKTIPAYLQFLEPGFEYWFVFAADTGDKVYDNAENLAKIREWFDTNFKAPAAARGIVSQLNIVRFLNHAHKPGPAFNVALLSAYRDGSDYFYRSNDDTQPQTKWASQLTSALLWMDPPNFGVAGPKHKGGNTRIMTHDFVHKTHFDVFGIYYPPTLADWYMDDWISHIYGNRHTCCVDSVFAIHSSNHGTRYKIDKEVECIIEYELHLGDVKIHNYLEKNNLEAKHHYKL